MRPTKRKPSLLKAKRNIILDAAIDRGVRLEMIAKIMEPGALTNFKDPIWDGFTPREARRIYKLAKGK